VLTLILSAVEPFDTDLPWCLLASLGVMSALFAVIGVVVGYAVGFGHGAAAEAARIGRAV